MNSETKIVIGICLILAGLVIGIVAFGDSKDTATPNIEATNVEQGQLVRDYSHTKGSTDAKATLVEFADFQCPACATANPQVEQLVASYGDKLRFVYRQFPLTNIHKNATITAKTAEAAGKQGKFWEMKDKLYDNQSKWDNSSAARDIIIGYVKDLGLNSDQFIKDLDDSTLAGYISTDMGDAIALGVDSTPTFFVNGQKFSGFSLDIKTAVDKALAN